MYPHCSQVSLCPPNRAVRQEVIAAMTLRCWEGTLVRRCSYSLPYCLKMSATSSLALLIVEQVVQRADDLGQALLFQMQVDGGSFDAGMPKELFSRGVMWASAPNAISSGSVSRYSMSLLMESPITVAFSVNHGRKSHFGFSLSTISTSGSSPRSVASLGNPWISPLEGRGATRSRTRRDATLIRIRARSIRARSVVLYS